MLPAIDAAARAPAARRPRAARYPLLAEHGHVSGEESAAARTAMLAKIPEGTPGVRTIVPTLPRRDSAAYGRGRLVALCEAAERRDREDAAATTIARLVAAGGRFRCGLREGASEQRPEELSERDTGREQSEVLVVCSLRDSRAMTSCAPSARARWPRPITALAGRSSAPCPQRRADCSPGLHRAATDQGAGGRRSE